MTKISIIGNENVTYYIEDSSNAKITINDLVNYEYTMNLEGADIDGYLTDASGEAFNFESMYNSVIDEFDVSGVATLATFVTDSSFGRFNVSLTSPPVVTYLQLTGGLDIFTDKLNKNTFKRVVLDTEGQDLSYVPVTPITTLVTEVFTKLCEEDISNGTAVQDLSFAEILVTARTHVKKMLGPDFSGVSINDIELDPYDEIYKADAENNQVKLKFAKHLALQNMKINMYINSCADNHDPNNFDENKDKHFRRKLFKHFGKRMHDKFKADNTKTLDNSMEDNDDDSEYIEDRAAADSGAKRRGPNNDGTGKRTNPRYFKKLPHHFRKRKDDLDTANSSPDDFIKGMVDLFVSFDEIVQENNAKPVDDTTLDGHVTGKKGTRPKPVRPTNKGYRPPWKHTGSYA